MDTLVDFLNWAWARHHNPLSWYIRPLFIVPFCYFAYKKSVRGMVWTIVAVTSSMFWFPAPVTPDPTATKFLEVERQWLTSPMTFTRFVLTALIPIWFVALAMAIQRRMWVAAFSVIAAGTALKVGWSFYVGGSSAWIVVPPVALGNAICAAFFIYAYWRIKHQTASVRS